MSENQSGDAALDRVLDLLYQAPVTPNGWDPALGAACDYVGAQCTDMTFIDSRDGTFSRIEHTRIDVAAYTHYISNFTDDPLKDNPRLPYAVAMKQGVIVVDSDIWTPRARASTPFFAEVLAPQRINDALTCFVRKGDSSEDWIVWLVHFAAKSGLPQEHVRDRFRRLIPHMRRACAVEDRLWVAIREKTVLADALDKVRDPIAVVDSAGRVKRANSAALAVLARGSGLSVAMDGRIVLATSAARADFERALSHCASPISTVFEGEPMPARQVMVPRADARSLVLTLHPLPRSAAGAYDATALVFIHDPDARLAKLSQTVQEGYGFTRAEAQLAKAILDGDRLKDYAAKGRVSINTVKTQLQALFAKTNTTRQADLVRLLKDLSSPA